MLQALRSSARRLRRTPLLTLGSIATFAVTIGGCAVALSVWIAIRSAGIGVRDPQSLLSLWVAPPACPACVGPVSLPTLQSWQRTYPAQIREIAGYATQRVTAELPKQQRLTLGVAEGDLFGVLGSQAVLGRLPQPSADGQRIENDVVISRSLWSGFFNRRRGVIGQTIIVHDVSYIVIGVLAVDPVSSSDIDLWVSGGSMGPAFRPPQYEVVARTRAAQSAASARSFGASLTASEPSEPSAHVVATPFLMGQSDIGGNSRLNVALGALLMVFLIGCANFSGLFLTRAISSAPELDIRAALGASRAELCGVAVAEIVVVAMVASILVLSVAMLFHADVQAILATPLGVRVPSANLATIGSVAALCMVTVVLVSFAPVGFIARRSGYDTLRSGPATPSRKQTRAQSVLIAVETAFSVVLVVGAVLLSESSLYAKDFGIGFDPSRVLVTTAEFGGTSNAAERVMMTIGLLERSLGPASVAVWHQVATSRFDGRPVFTRQELGETSVRLAWPPIVPSISIDASPGFFSTLGIPVVAGRTFTVQDVAASPPVVILNRVTAEHFWPGEPAVGKRLKLGPVDANTPWMTVVGIVGNSTLPSVGGFAAAVTTDQHASPLIFRPLAQVGLGARTALGPYASQVNFLARVDRRSRQPIGTTMDSIIASMLPGTLVEGAQPLNARLLASEPFQRVAALSALLTLIAALGLALVVIGFLTHTLDRVARRRRELAIRSALGATPRRLLFDVIRDSITLALVSVTAGIFGSLVLRLALRRVLDGPTPLVHLGLLVGVDSWDWRAYVAAIFMTVAAAVVAATIPAARFVNANPSDGLR